MNKPKLNVRITEVTVSVLPEDHPDHDVWSLRVSWRGGDRYAIKRGPFVLAVDQPGLTEPEYVVEPNPSSRTDEFKVRTRFDYDTAYRLACEEAPHVRSNGLTALEVLAGTR